MCDANHRTCEDLSPPSGSPLRYKVVAVDTGSAGLREGDVAIKDVGNAGTAPHAPQNLRLQSIDANGGLLLAWDAPSGRAVDFYRIYRDGQQVADRYDRTGDLTYNDTNPLPGSHDYYVTAVADDFSESNFSNRLTVAP